MLKVSVISPESVLFEGEVESLVAPAFDGEVGILPSHAPMVTLLGRGSKLVGGSIRTDVTAADLRSVLLDGFLPRVASDAMPARQRRVGFQELGLPYAADAAITKHLARFLRQPVAAAATSAVQQLT